MSIMVLFALFAIYVAIELPVGFALLLSTITFLAMEGAVPLTVVVQRMSSGLDSFPFLAIPLFILAGNLFNHAGIARRIFDFAESLVGHIRGSLGHVNVIASMIFAGMSGVAQADAAGLGQVEIREMRARGYDLDFSAAVTAASATIGPIIPPSVVMVIYAVTAGVSLGDLFLAGFVPGTLMGVTMMVLIYYLAVTGRIKAPVQPRASARVVGRSFLRALPALLAPVVLVVGILVGAATPTELGALAVIYATLLGFLYRDLTLRRFFRSLAESLVTTGTLAFVISAAIPFGWCIAVKNFPALVAEVVTGLTDNRWLVLLLLNIVLLIAGCFLETTAILLIATPTLYPLVTSYGIDPIHFGLVMLINLLIGTLTPPFGMILFIMMDITKLSLWQVTRAVMPFYIPLVVTLLLVTYFPQIVLFVPHWVSR